MLPRHQNARRGAYRSRHVAASRNPGSRHVTRTISSSSCVLVAWEHGRDRASARRNGSLIIYSSGSDRKREEEVMTKIIGNNDGPGGRNETYRIGSRPRGAAVPDRAGSRARQTFRRT